MLAKIPYLGVRPMLLKMMSSFNAEEANLDYSFQLYDKLIDGWIEREFRWIPDPVPVRRFSSRLALDLFVNSKRRGVERIGRDELLELAKRWNLDLKHWQITGRSLLNHDIRGDFKFSHRTIMEYLVAEAVYSGQAENQQVPLTAQSRRFIWEMHTHAMEQDSVSEVDLSNIDLRGLQPKLRSRSRPNLGRRDLVASLRRIQAYDGNHNPFVPGRLHFFQIRSLPDGLFLLDYSDSLMFSLQPAQSVEDANSCKLGGFADWRLPTVEEVGSLLTRETNSRGFHCHRILSDHQWSARIQTADIPWKVDFKSGIMFQWFAEAEVHLVRNLVESTHAH